ncbi:hypothetical protein DFQ27_000509 [Actinomortierella ambigua]|uniref:Calcineurin-like phosphoesterase domain-containing protein n=1 Tax=Actinomortierella ambigua TaxID=1343610 RepID=A0A9P6QGA8_9FUNG|nr:hypothetical protein DFQ27_000509 [Actinomortierella ambigua]
MVAVGDLHSDYPQAIKVLMLAGVVNDKGDWIGGTDTLVQTQWIRASPAAAADPETRVVEPDLVDRGPDTIKVYNLFDNLCKQAKAAGGQVVNLYGNHEVMNIGQDLRYVTEEDYASFGGREARRQAFDIQTGWLGQQIYANFNLTYIHNGHTVLSHGDMHPAWAGAGIDKMNHVAREALWNKDYHAPIFRTMGPIWWRGLAMEEDGSSETCRYVDAVKKALGVNRLISGHTPQHDKILSRCNGGYMVIDVGISSYYGAHLAALEIIDNKDGSQTVHALYPGGKILVN